ncbi:unnamed protein product [Cuscuta epithymum]|uniref:RING-type E3 ubiquitin transferase n=1 Tax=Cuscuta epithymum TaxID=186058 RepID=A0AAV0CAC9_9ASTE|nr:unnamed protein product [Cuscuta epithymum]
MELLNSSPPSLPKPTGNTHLCSGPSNFRRGSYHNEVPAFPQLPEIAEEAGCKVHVAVGKKKTDKAVSLIQWVCRNFGNSEICILHVHQPSPFIPTLLGRLPACQANPEVVSAFRNEERELMRKLVNGYLSICCRLKVKASIITLEADQIKKGLVDMVNEHKIRKLVIGAIPDCRKEKRSSRKASYVEQNAPSFCEIIFVNKGKLVFTRQATGFNSNSVVAQSPVCLPLPDSNSAFEEESLSGQLRETDLESESSRNEVIADIFKCNRLEAEAAETMKTKTWECAHVREIALRKEAELSHRTMIEEQDKDLKEKEEMTHKLNMTMRSIAILDTHGLETNCMYKDIAGEIRLIQTSIETLQKEKQKVQKQKDEARGRSCGKVWGVSSRELVQFSISDLQIATCHFSESFKIGVGGYGAVYKGELLDRTVAIKKLNPHYMQSQSDFLQQVQILGKLYHPHLVTLLGLCTEDWYLVYEYMPGGNLRDHLLHKSSITWKNRLQIVAQIAKGLLFLHTSNPEKIVHGNLKPENILLDSYNSCKICDFGISKLFPNQTLHCPSFRRQSVSKGAFSYTDPEFHVSGSLTTKSDIYSFGLIILQMLTGRSPEGLSREVRKAVSCRNLESILDSSAGDWSAFVARRLAGLGLSCCELNSRDRPELTPSLVRELEQLHTLEERVVPSFFLCPISQELMYDPQVAADGFTYEGEAIRGWLGSGRGTSPMTNLTLSHLDLTPNPSLRLAIQCWISNSH